MFDYDDKDRAELYTFQKHCHNVALPIVVLWIADIRILNTINNGQFRSMGPLRKFALINCMTLPFYFYGYNVVRQAYSDLKQHMVKRYLIQDGQVLYKRRINPEQ